MDIFKIQIPDEAVTGLCLQRKYLTKAQLEECQKIQQHLRENSEEKTLAEVFSLAEILSPEEKERLKSFSEFVNNRLQGIVLCQIGIQKRCLSDNILEMVLITHREKTLVATFNFVVDFCFIFGKNRAHFFLLRKPICLRRKFYQTRPIFATKS